MAQSRASKKLMNMAYGLGASVVIIGALFKIIHFEIGPLTGNVMLAIRFNYGSSYFCYFGI